MFLCYLLDPWGGLFTTWHIWKGNTTSSSAWHFLQKFCTVMMMKSDFSLENLVTWAWNRSWLAIHYSFLWQIITYYLHERERFFYRSSYWFYISTYQFEWEDNNLPHCKDNLELPMAFASTCFCSVFIVITKYYFEYCYNWGKSISRNIK